MSSESGLAHQAVLLGPAIDALVTDPQGFYIDGTFGRGGHSRRILDALGEHGVLLAIDKDPEAVVYAKQHFGNDPRFSIVHGAFSDIAAAALARGKVGNVAGILLDLGVSSPQLDAPERGFSFLRDGELDMRMNPQQGQSAKDWLSAVTETELVRVFHDYGEERYAKRIARAIVTERKLAAIVSTKQLAGIIARAHPAWEKGKDPATRCFQAIRIAINTELQELQQCLDASVSVLKAGGRLVVISFHSLEDRVVKRFIQQHCSGDDFPPDLPITQDQIKIRFRKLGKAIRATSAEIQVNPRSRSAIMRVAERTTTV